MKVTKEAVSDKPSTSVPPNYGNRTMLRVKSAVFGQSASSGNDMFTLETEIVRPQEWQSPLTGQKYDLTDHTIKCYLSVTQKTLVDIAECLVRLGIEEGCDTDELKQTNPETGKPMWIAFCKDKLVGKFVWAQLNSRESFDQTITGVENGKKVYTAVTDDAGKPVSKGWEFQLNAKDIRGLAQPPEGYEPKVF